MPFVDPFLHYLMFLCMNMLHMLPENDGSYKIHSCSCLIWEKCYEQVLQEPEARNLGGRVVGGVTQRLAARLLQQILRSPVGVTSL